LTPEGPCIGPRNETIFGHSSYSSARHFCGPGETSRTTVYYFKTPLLRYSRKRFPIPKIAARSPPRASRLLFITSYPVHRIASHRIETTTHVPIVFKTALSGARVRPRLRSNSRPTTGAALFLNLLLFSISTRWRRRDEFICLRYFEEMGLREPLILTGRVRKFKCPRKFKLVGISNLKFRHRNT